MISRLYKGLLQPAAPALRFLLRRRLARGKEDAARLPERWGVAGVQRPSGALVWLHAASVGESLSLQPLITHLRTARPDLSLLLTTGTVTSARLMASRLPPGVLHQFMPVDHPAWVETFLGHWKPDVVVWSESELWPNMLADIRQRKIPSILVNARLSARSHRRWSLVRGFARDVLSVFSLCLAQTEIEAERLRDLGAREVRVAGNLKYATALLPDDAAARGALVAAVDDRPLVLWASTHPGEEELALETHRALKETVPRLLTVIVPRHPNRGDEIATALAMDGARVGQRSRGALPEKTTDIYLADTLGELGVFYRLCPTVIMGGSFVDVGGHNPIEPAQLGAVVICGPQMYNFSKVREEFLAAQALLEVMDVAALVPLLRQRLQNPAAYDAIGRAGAAWTAQQAGVIERIYAVLAPLLPNAESDKTS